MRERDQLTSSVWLPGRMSSFARIRAVQAYTCLTGCHLVSLVWILAGPWREEDDRRMTAELCVFAADPNTPANASDTWRQGGFHLHQRSTAGASVKVGTQKWYECTGREPGQKQIPGQKCGFRVKVEFVSHVDGTEHSGWVVKQVIGGSHQVGDSEHKLAITTAEVTSDARLSAGTSQLSLEPYISLGRTLASAGMSAAQIHRALRQRCTELGHTGTFDWNQVRCSCSQLWI